MKNTILSIVICFAVAAISQAQTVFGVKGGVHLANYAMDNTEVTDHNLKIGFTVGGFAKLEAKDWLLIQPELLFTLKGSRYDFGQTSVKANLSYVDIPVAGVIQIFGTPISIHGGPQLSFLTSVKYKYEGDRFGSQTVVDDNKDSYRNIDLGGFLGLGLLFDKLQFEARLVRGIINVEKDREIFNGESVPGRKSQNTGIQFTAGIIF